MKFLKKTDWVTTFFLAFMSLITGLFTRAILANLGDAERSEAKNKASRPGVEAVQNIYTSCVGNNLIVAEYEHYGSVEPKNVQVFQNDSSCVGGDL